MVRTIRATKMTIAKFLRHVYVGFHIFFVILRICVTLFIHP
jgi:hypothetical protein